MADKNKKRNNRNNNNYDDDFNPKFRKQRKKVCALCNDKNFELDYKNPEQLRKFINDKGKILPRRTTGACAKHQRDITLAVKRARHIAILPYATKDEYKMAKMGSENFFTFAKKFSDPIFAFSYNY